MEWIKTKLLPALKKLKSWLRNEDTNKEIMAAIAGLKSDLIAKIDDNERARLRSEICRYYDKAVSGRPIYPDELIYLQTEVFSKYINLGGNGAAHQMMEFIQAYITKQA